MDESGEQDDRFTLSDKTCEENKQSQDDKLRR